CLRLGVRAVEVHAGSAYLEHGLVAALGRAGLRVYWPLRERESVSSSPGTGSDSPPTEADPHRRVPRLRHWRLVRLLPRSSKCDGSVRSSIGGPTPPKSSSTA